MIKASEKKGIEVIDADVADFATRHGFGCCAP